MPKVTRIRKLTDIEEKFVDAYLQLNTNVTMAAKAAGCPPPARRAGEELLSRPHVVAAITERVRKAQSDKVMTLRELMILMTDVARGRPFSQLLNGKVLEIPSQMRDRLKASEYLLKILLPETLLKNQAPDTTATNAISDKLLKRVSELEEYLREIPNFDDQSGIVAEQDVDD